MLRFLSLFETVTLPPGNWHFLGGGSPSTSGQHSWDERPEIPASDVYHSNWSNSIMWVFKDESPEELAILDQVLHGHRAATAFGRNSASSFHLDIGEVAVLVDLPPETNQTLEDHGIYLTPWTGFKESVGRPVPLDQFDEFMYPGFQGLMKLMADRGELDHTEMPGPEHYNRPRPGEDQEAHMARRIQQAKAQTVADLLRQKKAPPRDGD